MFLALSRLSPVVLLASPAVVDTLAMAPMLQKQLVHHGSSPGQSRSPPRYVGGLWLHRPCTEVHRRAPQGPCARGRSREKGDALHGKLGVKLTFFLSFGGLVFTMGFETS